MADDRLTPAEARKHFGELQDPTTRTFGEFDRPEGIWRPVYGPGMTLEEYRLYQRHEGVKAAHWRRSKPRR